MAQETNDGIAYLMALRQSTEPKAKTAAASDSAQAQPPETTVAESSDHYQGPNKRRAPRYKCEGSAELREEGCDVRTWATFTDVSLHGCYVEAQATYPAGTILNVKLEANGIRIETKGNVRVSYPYLGMGIAFVGLTVENEIRLRQMLAKVSQGCAVVGPGVTSTLPAAVALSAAPEITNATAAIQELVQFFETRKMLMRDDFLRLLKKSQTPHTSPQSLPQVFVAASFQGEPTGPFLAP